MNKYMWTILYLLALAVISALLLGLGVVNIFEMVAFFVVSAGFYYDLPLGYFLLGVLILILDVLISD